MEDIALNKSAFSENTRYTVALKNSAGRVSPANIYVYKMFDDYMIARHTNADGLLLKIAYGDVAKIVKTIPENVQSTFMIPDYVLDPANWKDRDQMTVYGSSARVGK